MKFRHYVYTYRFDIWDELIFFKLNYGNNDSEENGEDMGAKYCDNVTRPDWEKMRNESVFMEQWFSTLREYDKVTLFFHHKLSG